MCGGGVHVCMSEYACMKERKREREWKRLPSSLGLKREKTNHVSLEKRNLGKQNGTNSETDKFLFFNTEITVSKADIKN